MEHEVINQTCPEMQELIEDLGEALQRMQAVAQSHRPLFAGEVYLTGSEVCQRLFLSPRTLQDYRDKGILPYTQIAGKILYKLSDINRVLEENYIQAYVHNTPAPKNSKGLRAVALKPLLKDIIVSYLLEKPCPVSISTTGAFLSS